MLRAMDDGRSAPRFVAESVAPRDKRAEENTLVGELSVVREPAPAGAGAFDRRASRVRWLLCALLLIGCGVQYRHLSYFYDGIYMASGLDDAYISFRYARNLVDWGELAFNPGEVRVAGYSNPLHVLLSAGLYRLVGEDSLYAAVAVISALAAGAALWLVHARLSRQSGERIAAVAALAFATSPSIWLHTTSGLETGLVLSAQSAAWILSRHMVRQTPPAPASLAAYGISIAVLTALRIDGFVLPAILAAYFLIQGRPRLALSTVLTVGAVFGSLVLFYYAYYGDPLPNTVYAKTSGTLTERIVFALPILPDIAAREGMWPAIFGMVLGPVIAFKAVRSSLAQRSVLRFARALPLECVVLLGLFGYYLLVGGDVFYERFLLLAFPVGATCLIEGMHTLRAPTRWQWVAFGAIALCPLAALAADNRFTWVDDKYDAWIVLGRFLGQRHPGASMAIDAAGKIPYFSKLRSLDMLGLSDRHIAREPPREGVNRVPGHNKFDPDYVLGTRPDLIVAWIEKDGDLAWGMDRAKWSAAGYRIKYLVSSVPRSDPRDEVIDVGAQDAPDVRTLVEKGYLHAVLAR